MVGNAAGVLVVGSANVDLVVRVGRLPRAGETALGGEMREHWGGKGANQAVAALRAGASVRFLAMLGDDAWGAAYRRRLLESGVSPAGLLTCKARTGTALIVVEEGGENQIAVAPGANALLTPGRMRGKTHLLDFGAVVLAQLEVPAASVVAAFRRGRKRGALNVLNPAPAVRELPPDLLRLADVVVPNETETALLAGLARPPASEEELLGAARVLRERGPARVVITLGSRGAFFLDGDAACVFSPPGGVRALDTTGAGDAFCGALAARLAEGAGFEEAVCFAVAAGACAVEKRGAQEGLPARRRIVRRRAGVVRKAVRVD